MFDSIRSKFIAIYMILIFIGMLVAGVFIIKSYEEYQFNLVDKKLNNISDIILQPLQNYDDLDSNSDGVQLLVDGVFNLGLREEIYVVSINDNKIIATSTENRYKVAAKTLEMQLLTAGAMGEVKTKDIDIKSGNTIIRAMDRVFPIINDGKITGLLYLRYDLREVIDNLSTSMKIIIQATILALLTTFFIGYIVSKSITDPINAITVQAYKMIKGQFNQRVEVKSNDEIGKLGDIFNILTERLDVTLNEMSREKSKLETIINYMDDGLIAVSKDNEVIHLNPKAMKMLDLEESTLIDFNFFISVYDSQLVVDKILENQELPVGTSVISFKESIYSVHYAPYKNEQGIFDGIVYVFQNITEQEKLNEMRKEFVANVSHELKTPLTTIKSYAETILDNMDGGMMDKQMQQQFLEVIDSEADRMTRLVRNLLQLSSFDAKNVVFDKEFKDYNNLVNKAILKVKVTSEKKNQKILFHSEIEKAMGYFDYDRIEQVVLNILTNAIKYTENGGKILVSTKEDNGFIQIQISDTGMGIPKEDLKYVFDRFYRVDKARSRKMGGTGLGLAIAKEIVESHGGEIEITSTLDIGTNVIISLPLDNV